MPLPLYYISAEEYSKINASGFHFLLAKRHHVENQQEHKKTFTDEHGAASVNVVEVVVPMLGEEEVLFIYLPFWSGHRHT